MSNMSNSVKAALGKLLVLLAWSGVGCTTPTGIQAETETVTVEKVLSWLPGNTESIVVAESFIFDSKIDGDMSLVPEFQLLTLAAFFVPGRDGPNKTGPIAKAMEGAGLRFGLKAGRQFRHKGGVGPISYEGCDIAVFDDAKIVDKVWKTVEKLLGKRVQNMSVIAVVLEEEIEGIKWTYYLARPRDKVLLCASNETYLKEIVKRMEGAEQSNFLEAIRIRDEWKVVEREDSLVWCIRIFRPENAMLDPGSPLNKSNALGPFQDRSARGSGFSLAKDRKTLLAWYLGGAKDCMENGRRIWMPPQSGIGGKAKLVEEGIVRLAIDLSRLSDSVSITFIARCMTGHLVFL